MVFAGFPRYQGGNELSSKVLQESLICRGLTLSTAESCTGGMLGSTLTSIPGSSGFFLGGVITYSNSVKERLLGVSSKTLAAHGAVSRETAEEMVSGARRIFGSDLAVSITGVAGPDGGTVVKPVGTVFISVTDGENTITSENHFKGDRDLVRQASVKRAISMVMEFVGV